MRYLRFAASLPFNVTVSALTLHNSAEVAVGCKLQPLLLGPSGDSRKATKESHSPSHGAQTGRRLMRSSQELIEDPHVDKME